MDTSIAGAGSDRRGNVHLIYRRSSGGIVAESSYRYAKIDAKEQAASASERMAPRDSPSGILRVRAVVGDALPSGATCPVISVDPESGTALAGYSHLRIGDMWRETRAWPMHKAFCWEMRTASAGRDAFFALVLGQDGSDGRPVELVRLAGDAWSVPVRVGVAKVSGVFGIPAYALAISGADDGRLFLVWPRESGIVGRWFMPAP
ncbi:MAG: hypothetical protein FIB06_04895 [Betaproteobacteria bacterium]|nr:hypothetical protein [Betaproteobacteria bacterium]